MRITADDAICRTSSIKILLNGREVKHCVIADSDNSYVIAYAKNEKDEFVISGGEIKQCKLEGVVEIFIDGRRV